MLQTESSTAVVSIQSQENEPRPVAVGEVVNDLELLPTPDLVKKLHDGTARAAELSPELRQRCIEYLTHEGYHTEEVAQVMRISERTVQRDRAAFRSEQAIKPDMTLGDEMFGEYRRLAEASVRRLVRLSRDADTPAYARLWAEDAAVRTHQRLIETLTSYGYIRGGNGRLSQMLFDDPAEKARRAKRHKDSIDEAYTQLFVKPELPPKKKRGGKQVDALKAILSA